MIQHTFSAEGFEKTDKLQKYVEKRLRTSKSIYRERLAVAPSLPYALPRHLTRKRKCMAAVSR